MSDNLKVAKECGATVLEDGCIIFHHSTQLDKHTSRILASQQAAHDAEIARLNALVGALQEDKEIAEEQTATANTACAMKDAALLRADTALSGDFKPEGSLRTQIHDALSASHQQVSEWGRKQLAELQRENAELTSKLAEQQAAVYTVRAVLAGCEDANALKAVAHLQKHFTDNGAELRKLLEGKVPEGWQLVPATATRAMQEAAAKLQADRCPEPPSFGDFYSAMLAAASQAHEAELRAELLRQVGFWKNSSEEWRLAYTAIGGTASESGKEELRKLLEEAKSKVVPEGHLIVSAEYILDHANWQEIDGACSICNPSGEYLIEGFACAKHRAEAMLAAAPQPKEPKQ